MTDIGTAAGAFDAAFVAASHIVGVKPHLLSYNVRSGSPGEEGALPITIDVEINLGGKIYSGSSSGVDLVRCSLEAWLDAIAKANEQDLALRLLWLQPRWKMGRKDCVHIQATAHDGPTIAADQDLGRKGT